MSAVRDSVAWKAAELVKYYSPLKGPPLFSVGLLVMVPLTQPSSRFVGLEDIPELREIQVVSSSPPWPRLDVASLIWPERFAHYTIAALLVRFAQ